MSLATPTRRMPHPEQIREFLADLLGKAVTIEVDQEADLNDATAGYQSAAYVDDEGNVAGVCIADIAAAAAAGGSLAMIPKPVVEESISAGELAENLRENYYEVANILTGLLNGPSVAHLRIRDLVAGVPDDARDLVMKAPGRRTYRLTIGDHTSGLLALYAL